MRYKLPLILLSLVVLLLAVAYQPLRGFYHWRMMDARKQEMHTSEAAHSNINAQYEYHRDRLVDLGYLEYRTYHFPVQETADIHRWLWERVLNRFPNNDHVMLGYPDNTLQVWAEPEKIHEWDEFADQIALELRTVDQAPVPD